MIVVGFVAAIFRTVQNAGLEIFAYNISHKIRMAYFRAALGKDSTWFDSNNPNELGTKILKESTLIYMGIGAKVGQFYGVFS